MQIKQAAWRAARAPPVIGSLRSPSRAVRGWEHACVRIERVVDEGAIRNKADTPGYEAAVSKVMPLLAQPPEGRRLVQVVPK